MSEQRPDAAAVRAWVAMRMRFCLDIPAAGEEIITEQYAGAMAVVERAAEGRCGRCTILKMEEKGLDVPCIHEQARAALAEVRGGEKP